jgi:anti-sigma regulatory factor (Ser/Thr protein kinase)
MPGYDSFGMARVVLAAGEKEMTVTQAAPVAAVGGYRHEAFLYSGKDEFLAGTLPFIRRAVSAGNPILVAVSGEKIGTLCSSLGADAEQVGFADMAGVGSNPARIIARWQAFISEYAGAMQLCGIGEHAYPGRSPAELAECELHEALLNVAFDAATPFWLLCPYDVVTLPRQVIEGVQRTHPFVARGEQRRPSGAFRQLDPASPFDRPAPPRPAQTAFLPFSSGDLRRVRAFVTGAAEQAGLGHERATGMTLAVSEIASNSLRHGGGRGELRIWTDGRSLVCEVSDSGHITEPLAGRVRPAPDAGGGAGLWLANQLCDLVEIYSSARGTTVRLRQGR